MNNPDFNGKVSIITKSEIRYEGTLAAINPQQQNLTLKDVRSFGTEGRRPGNEIPPVSQTYDLIVFRAQEIKTVNVIQPPPAPVASNPQPAQEKEQEATVPAPPKEKVNPRTFDYDDMLEKTDDIQKLKSQAQETKPKYEKSNFFDNLSSSITEKNQQRGMTHQDRYDSSQYSLRKIQNQQDTETFGQFYKQNNTYKRKKNPNNNHHNYNNRQNTRTANRTQVVYVEKKPEASKNEQQ